MILTALAALMHNVPEYGGEGIEGQRERGLGALRSGWVQLKLQGRRAIDVACLADGLQSHIE